MPDTVLSSLSYLIFISCEENIIIPILHIRKLRHREVEQSVKNYTANV